MKRRKPRQEPAQCRCAKPADTPEWHGKRRSGAGLTGHHGAYHGDPFGRKDKGCIHSELHLTTRGLAKKPTVNRLRLQ